MISKELLKMKETQHIIWPISVPQLTFSQALSALLFSQFHGSSLQLLLQPSSSNSLSGRFLFEICTGKCCHSVGLFDLECMILESLFVGFDNCWNFRFLSSLMEIGSLRRLKNRFFELIRIFEALHTFEIHIFGVVSWIQTFAAKPKAFKLVNFWCFCIFRWFYRFSWLLFACLEDFFQVNGWFSIGFVRIDRFFVHSKAFQKTCLGLFD